jgi:hypothetical protein
MDKKLNPLQMVAREMSDHSDLDQETIEAALVGLLTHLQSRAMSEITEDHNSVTARQAAVQYRVLCETIAMFGTQLITYEDMDEDMMTGDSN